MSCIKGYDGAVKIGSTPTLIGQTKVWTLNTSKDTADVTTMDASGWKEYCSTLKGWAGSVTVLFDPADAGQIEAVAAFESGDSVALELILNEGGGVEEWTYSGSAIVTTMPIASDVSSLVEVTFDFQGTGAMTTAQGTA